MEESSSRTGPGFFTRFATGAAKVFGHAGAFAVSLVLLVGWALSGPLLGFSDTWQLVINTGTTIVTFLMVFVIQNTQNRDSAALHLKLDAVMRELEISNSRLYRAEEEGAKELEALRRQLEDESVPEGS
jgi:low affinity Fe/Cu permease